MSLKTKLFCFLVLVPVSIIGFFFSMFSSTFVSTQTAGIFENQLQLLNSVHLLLSKIDSRDLALSTKNLFSQEGLSSLVITDSSGKIRYAGNPKIVGKTISETLGEKVQKNIQEQTSEEGSFESAGPDSKKILISFFKLELGDNRFFMLLSKPKSVAIRASHLFMFKSLATVIALLAAFFIAGRLIFRSLTQGLNQISQAMLALGQGNWLSPLPVTGDSEVGVLARDFYSMRKQLHNFLNETQKKTKQEAQEDFSGTLRNMFLSAADLKLDSAQLAAALETNPNSGTFWHHCTKTTPAGTYLLFLMAEAPRGDALASLSGLCRWSLEKNPLLVDPKDCMQDLTTLVAGTFGKNVSWNYCLCSLNLQTGVLNWSTLSYTSPPPILFNSTEMEPQSGTEGQLSLKTEDFIILHSAPANPKISIEAKIIETLTAPELLNILTKTIDQSYLVVKWRKL